MVAKACYVLNWKNPVTFNDKDLEFPVNIHFSKNSTTLGNVPVQVWDPKNGIWEKGQHTLLTWGRGYACVSTGDKQPRWIPAKWVRPDLTITCKEMTETEN